jgi:maltooligosyltrehalose trehalohydrolase
MNEQKGRKRKDWKLGLGAHYSRQGVQFRVWAPKASSLVLEIEGEPDEILMTREEKGYFTAFVSRLRPGARYFYLVNGKERRPDPVSRYQPEGVHGPSEVVDPEEFEWTDQDWKGISLDAMIMHEIHTGTFTPQGTFEAILPLLDYLKDDLGVTALELMPVAQFPGGRNWGYDGAYLYAPQNSYGGPLGLKKLVDRCHHKGLAVLLDVVYNHLGPEGNYLGDYGPYFTDRYKTPWGPAINFDGAGSDEVRRFVVDNALFWATEYHVDGLRLDAVHGIFDFSPRHILGEVREAVQQQGRKLGRPVWVIAESDLNDVRVIHPPQKGGYGLDAQWNDDFHHCLHALLTGERTGYYQDFGDISQLAKALREGFVLSGQYSSYRRRRHGSSSRHVPSTRFVIFSQNHDHVGNRMKGDRLTTSVSFEALKLAAGIVLLSPNLPLLFMGEEYGETAPFQYFVSHSDPGLVDAVRKGRREEFAAFRWEGDIPDPQDEGTFLRSKINLELRQQGTHAVLLKFYRRLIALRKEILPLHSLKKGGLGVRVLEGTRAILVDWACGNGRAFSIFNVDDRTVRAEPFHQEGGWKKAMDSASKEWGGSGETAPGSIPAGSEEITFLLPPLSFALFRRSEGKD